MHALGAEAQAADTGQRRLALGLQRIAQQVLVVDSFVEQQQGGTATAEADAGPTHGQCGAEVFDADFQLLTRDGTDGDHLADDAQVTTDAAPAAHLQVGTHDGHRAAGPLIVKHERNARAVAQGQDLVEAAA